MPTPPIQSPTSPGVKQPAPPTAAKTAHHAVPNDGSTTSESAADGPNSPSSPLTPGHTKGLAGFWSAQTDEVKVKKKRLEAVETSSSPTETVVENVPQRLDGVVRAEDPGEWQKPVPVEHGRIRNVAQSFQQRTVETTSNRKDPAAVEITPDHGDGVVRRNQVKSTAQRLSTGKPAVAPETLVLNRSSATVVLAENQPIELSPDVVRSSGASSWDDVGELEAGRTRNLLQHWRATEDEAAVPKTSTTRYQQGGEKPAWILEIEAAKATSPCAIGEADSWAVHHDVDDDATAAEMHDELQTGVKLQEISEEIAASPTLDVNNVRNESQPLENFPENNLVLTEEPLHISEPSTEESLVKPPEAFEIPDMKREEDLLRISPPPTFHDDFTLPSTAPSNSSPEVELDTEKLENGSPPLSPDETAIVVDRCESAAVVAVEKPAEEIPEKEAEKFAEPEDETPAEPIAKTLIEALSDKEENVELPDVSRKEIPEADIEQRSTTPTAHVTMVTPTVTVSAASAAEPEKEQLEKVVEKMQANPAEATPSPTASTAALSGEQHGKGKKKHKEDKTKNATDQSGHHHRRWCVIM